MPNAEAAMQSRNPYRFRFPSRYNPASPQAAETRSKPR
jgi:hypothetical protein